MKMNKKELTLNDRLASASKKFTKACEQINHLKQELSVYIPMFASYNEMHDSSSSDEKSDFNLTLSREMCRQKIESLQNFKSIFFMYAHQKAEEITKIQCELYGEDAVRNAYDGSSPREIDNNGENEESIVESSIDEQTYTSGEEFNEIEHHTENEFELGDTNNEEDEDNSTWNTDYWPNFEPIHQVRRPSTQLQLIEYDFLTA